MFGCCAAAGESLDVQALQSWAAQLALQTNTPVMFGCCAAAGESLEVQVLRGGKLLDLKYQLKQRRPLVPILHGVDCVPSYFIVGGLVFVPLSIPFLEHAYGGTHIVPSIQTQASGHAHGQRLDWVGTPCTQPQQ